MRWYEATLYRREVTGKDKLGHEISQEAECGSCIVRKAPVKAEQMDVEGNDHKSITRVFLTTTPPCEFRGVSSVKVWQRKFNLVNVASLENGHTMLTCYFPKLEVAHESEAYG